MKNHSLQSFDGCELNVCTHDSQKLFEDVLAHLETVIQNMSHSPKWLIPDIRKIKISRKAINDCVSNPLKERKTEIIQRDELRMYFV